MKSYDVFQRNVQQILLEFEDGRRISIIQDKKSVDYGHNCEVWIEGQEDPVRFLTAEQLITYLMINKLTVSSERTWEKN
jgi:hypothetical protein|tara:strand:- start:1045 stop:1281 length:237 start_codon:yes stop_codon:yes gene_type:complete